MIRLIALFIFITAASIGAADEAYRIYVNERYGYAISYPSAFLPQGVSGSGDGQVFKSPAGDAELRVSAGACVEGMNTSPREYMARFSKLEKSGSVRLAYQSRGKEFAVVSGLRGDRIFYNKIFIIKEWCTEFNFNYAKAQSKQYDAVAARISKSFEP